LADEKHLVAEAYGVWVQKVMAGRTYYGIRRTTVLIGPDGKVLHVFENVKPEGHSREVLEALRAI
jgi:peroxiredoxin Q/BCP